ncbi:hypothetical protein T492DRAFT_870893 [Pavlovales sp. CCMP2436]|nr:hypothetical protein T492DRAFT_870893 [Pavlovales sp. CCMP2436]
MQRSSFSAAQSGTLKAHKRTHSGERPFPCDEAGCEYRAAQSNDLATHKRTHMCVRRAAPRAQKLSLHARDMSRT